MAPCAGDLGRPDPRAARGHHTRGRLAGIEMLSYSIGPLGGQTRAGLVADAWSVRGSVTSGGVLCVVGVVGAAVWLRDFWFYDARTDEHAVRERELRAGQAAPGPLPDPPAYP